MTGLLFNGFPLQTTYFREDNPMDIIVILIFIGAIILISVIVRLVNGGGSSSGSSMGGIRSSSAAPKKFNAFTFRRLASSYSLDKDQAHLLEFVLRSSSVTDPERVLKNSAQLDKCFKKAFRTIEKNATTEEEAQQRLSRLFSLRNTIEAAPANTSGISSTTQIPDNTPSVLSFKKDSYTVRIINASGETLMAEAPKNAMGSSIKIPKGTAVTLSFFTKSSKGFSFESRVIENLSTSHGPAIELSHSGKSKPLVQRRYKRKQTSAACVFHLVFLDNTKTKGKQAPKLVVDTRRFTGTILDISAGGCSIKSSAPVQVGSRLKIELDYSDNAMITVLGQVLRTNRSGAIGTIIHVKFLKVPRRSFNNINAMVFGYDEE